MDHITGAAWSYSLGTVCGRFSIYLIFENTTTCTRWISMTPDISILGRFYAKVMFFLGEFPHVPSLSPDHCDHKVMITVNHFTPIMQIKLFAYCHRILDFFFYQP